MGAIDEFAEQKKVALDHHTERLAGFGKDVRALSWGSEDSQWARFEILVAGIEIFLSPRAILDVGCGFGDLLEFMNRKNKSHSIKYLGIDLNPTMIEEAKKRYPSGRFEVRDILQAPPAERFDYVVGSGLFFLRVKNWYSYMAAMVGCMYEIATVGVAVNFLSAFSPGKKGKHSFYADPGAVFNTIAHVVSKKIMLRHDYRANDFTLFIYR